MHYKHFPFPAFSAKKNFDTITKLRKHEWFFHADEDGNIPIKVALQVNTKNTSRKKSTNELRMKTTNEIDDVQIIETEVCNMYHDY